MYLNEKIINKFCNKGEIHVIIHVYDIFQFKGIIKTVKIYRIFDIKINTHINVRSKINMNFTESFKNS